MAVYREAASSPRFLVLRRVKNWEGWELPKGNLEEGYEETARQELEEEAGITGDEILELEELGETVSWEYERDGEEREKEYRAFLVEVDQDARVDVTGNPHEEHEKGFFLGFEDARALLTYDDQVKVLEKANDRVT